MMEPKYLSVQMLVSGYALNFNVLFPCETRAGQPQKSEQKIRDQAQCLLPFIIACSHTPVCGQNF